MVEDPKALRELSGKVAIVGVGNTDYGADWQAARAKEESYTPPDSASLATTAFERALADSGLKKEDIDGLGLSVGGSTPEAMAGILGIRPRYTETGGVAVMIRSAAQAIDSGKCTTVALVYGLAQRTMGVQYGGETYRGDGTNSYYYYHPWGWSAQAAHWALMFKSYQTQYGATEEQLGSVALTMRKHAMLNDNAVMRSPLTLQDYMDSRYVVRPLHLFDLCLVNDGGVSLIIRKTDMSRDLPHDPVLVAGWADVHVPKTKMYYMVKDLLKTQIQEAGKRVFGMASMNLEEIDHFQPYDAASMHVITQLEGFGFCKPGEGLSFAVDGQIGLGGKLPVNTSGGMLSESYMQGWNHVAEATRQLRHEAGNRQVKDIETSMFAFTTTESSTPYIFKRGV